MKLKANVFFLSVTFALLTGLIPFGSTMASSPEALKIVENQNVCMVTDMHFGKKQIPVTHQSKTYYGCCENCKATLTKDAKARMAIDPISGKSIDKARAVVAAREDNSVLYFESRKTFDQYAKNPASGKAGRTDSHESHDHSHDH